MGGMVSALELESVSCALPLPFWLSVHSTTLKLYPISIYCRNRGQIMKTRSFKPWLLLFLLAVGFICMASVPAKAQRPTTFYGYAYEGSSPFSYNEWGWWPFCKVAVWDDYGNHWSAFSNPRWYLTNMPSNRWYYVQAKVWSSLYSPVSGVYRVWVPEKRWCQVNATPCPNIGIR